MKKIVISFVFALLVLPSVVSAATVDELNTKLQRLLLEVEQVRQELVAAQAAAKPSVTPSTASKDTLCVQLTRALSIGVSDQQTDGEVTKLQRVLAEDRTLYPEGLVTGYFGPATQMAVKRLQSRENILAGNSTPASAGVVESSTRMFLASRCGTSVPVSSGTTARPSLTNNLESALATITLDTMSSSVSSTPTISGSAKNLAAVSVSIRSSEVVYANDSVPVTNGRWSVTIPTLRNGSYQVIAKGAGGGAIAVGFITIDVPSATVASSTPRVPTDTTLKVVAPTLVSKVILRLNGSDKGTTILPGSKVLISWRTENVSSCVFVSNPPIELSGSALASESGKSSGPILKTTVFTLTCIGADGTFVSHSLTANVAKY
ncbi:MAG: peptidoglycan-binding domain-containing protein [Patescibacteria group bacterium]